jgi:hypothetical protein
MDIGKPRRTIYIEPIEEPENPPIEEPSPEPTPVPSRDRPQHQPVPAR